MDYEGSLSQLPQVHNSVVVGSSPIRPTQVCVAFVKPHAGRELLFLIDFSHAPPAQIPLTFNGGRLTRQRVLSIWDTA